MCNLYDIGPKRHRDSNDWDSAVSAAIHRFKKTTGIRKTDTGPVLVMEQKEPHLKSMRWGFQRSFNPAINNARTEKLDSAWSEAWKDKRRCLIPISTFYEWSGPTGDKQTFAFQSQVEGNWLWAAGLWESGKDEPAYSMLTTNASPAVSPIHDRMPVLLSADSFDEFLSAQDPRDLLANSPVSLDIFRCENPLKNPSDHTGPREEDFLPGFDGMD
tara:strand:+ start:4506 stop:5150 length:645 start_codon:yes stop_codon:yes gene_type:complete